MDCLMPSHVGKGLKFIGELFFPSFYFTWVGEREQQKEHRKSNGQSAEMSTQFTKVSKRKQYDTINVSSMNRIKRGVRA